MALALTLLGVQQHLQAKTSAELTGMQVVAVAVQGAELVLAVMAVEVTAQGLATMPL
jgi:hypothetical protein